MKKGAAVFQLLHFFVFLPTELPKRWIPVDGPAEVPQRAEGLSCRRGGQSDGCSRQTLRVLLLPTV